MLPRVPYIMHKNKRQAVTLGGINYSTVTQDGDLADSYGICARDYPYLSTRRAMRGLPSLSGASAMTFFRGKWVVIKGNAVYYGGERIGSVTPGEKQFAAINTKLVIYPDEVYIDSADNTVKPMGAEVVGHGVTFIKNSVEIKDTDFTIASGLGGTFSGSTFTVGADKEVWSSEIQYYESEDQGRFWLIGRFFGSMPAGSTTFTGTYLPYDEIYKMYSPSDFVGCNVRTSLNSYHTITSVVIDGNTMTIELDSAVKYADPALYVTLPNKIFSSGDIITISGKGPATVEYISGNTMYLDRALGITMYSPSSVTIMKKSWGDLTESLTVGMTVYFPDAGVSSEITAVTATTVTISGTFTEKTVTGRIYIKSIGGDNLASYFKAGDVVQLTRISGGTSSNNGISFKIAEISGKKLVAEADIFTEGEDTSGVISIERSIPHMDYVCTFENRVYGCSNETGSIYASALGDPTNFNDFSGLSTDSYAVPVGSEGDFTGCIGYGGSVLFFKEMTIHKLMGSYPAEYATYEYTVEGVQKGSHKSLVIINEVLYYKGIHGVFAYNGAPSLISANFGEREFESAVAGGDGDTYYVSMSDADGYKFFSYETRKGVWLLEGREKVTDFANSGGDMYLLADGEISLYNAEETKEGMEWLAQFTPFYETIDGRKSCSRLLMRLELPAGSYVIVEMRFDGGVWQEAGKVIGKRQDVVPIMVPINRCDKFEIRLRGKGKCKILSLMREFYVRGDK